VLVAGDPHHGEVKRAVDDERNRQVFPLGMFPDLGRQVNRVFVLVSIGSLRRFPDVSLLLRPDVYDVVVGQDDAVAGDQRAAAGDELQGLVRSAEGDAMADHDDGPPLVGIGEAQRDEDGDEDEEEPSHYLVFSRLRRLTPAFSLRLGKSSSMCLLPFLNKVAKGNRRSGNRVSAFFRISYYGIKK